jgi:acetyltransferase-like isoleucine patch superfamily enzyme
MKSWIAAFAARLLAPRMVYGYRHRDGRWLAHTRISTHTYIEQPKQLDLADHVYIGHFNVVDASGGLIIGEGCQITNYVSILTHSSHRAMRLMGRKYFGHPDPVGYVRRPTRIGAYTFIGPHSVIAPGAQLGRGVLIRAYSYVSGVVPDFAVLAPREAGEPAQVVGDTRDMDQEWLQRHPEVRSHYEAWAGLLQSADAASTTRQENQPNAGGHA